MFRSNSTFGNVSKDEGCLDTGKKGKFLDVNKPEIKPFLSRSLSNKSTQRRRSKKKNLTVSFNGSHLSIVQNFDNVASFINKPKGKLSNQWLFIISLTL